MEDQREEELWYEYKMRKDVPKLLKQFDCPMEPKNRVTLNKEEKEELYHDIAKSTESMIFRLRKV